MYGKNKLYDVRKMLSSLSFSLSFMSFELVFCFVPMISPSQQEPLTLRDVECNAEAAPNVIATAAQTTRHLLFRSGTFRLKAGLYVEDRRHQPLHPSPPRPGATRPRKRGIFGEAGGATDFIRGPRHVLS